MWNSKNKNSDEVSIANSTSFFASGFKLVGNIDANNDVRIEGTVEGNISTTKKVIIGSSGSIKGNVKATELCVLGEINGEIRTSGIVVLGETAVVHGIIIAERLQVDPGAIVEASIKRFHVVNGENKRQSKLSHDKKDTVPDQNDFQLAKAL